MIVIVLPAVALLNAIANVPRGFGGVSVLALAFLQALIAGFSDLIYPAVDISNLTPIQRLIKGLGIPLILGVATGLVSAYVAKIVGL